MTILPHLDGSRTTLALTLEFLWSSHAEDRVLAISEILPELKASLHWCHDTYTLDDDCQRMEECRRRWGQMEEYNVAVLLTQGGRFLGEATLDAIDFFQGSANVSYWIRKDARGRRHATDAVSILAYFAFRELELQRLWFRADADNAASLGVARELGAHVHSSKQIAGRSHRDKGKQVEMILDRQLCGGLSNRFATAYLTHKYSKES